MKNTLLLFYFILVINFSVDSPVSFRKRLGIEQGLSNNYVVSITQDKQGFLWFATEEGLNKFDGTRFITYYKNDLAHNNQESPATSLTGCMLTRNVYYLDSHSTRRTKCI